MEKIKAVIIGFAHMHVNEIGLYISEQPDIELVGCADIKPDIEEASKSRYTRAWNLKNVCENYNVKPHDNYKKMLDELKPEVAFILSENAKKVEIVEECAKRGINVCIEKPMAVSLAEALKIKQSVEKYGIEALVNWPTTWRPYIHQLKDALDKGIVGDLIRTSYLNGHTGPLGVGARHRGVTEAAEGMTDQEKSKAWWYQAEQGGGTFLDICCYGCMYSRLFNKENAISVMAMGVNLNTSYANTEDNTVAIIKYPSTISVVEGTWTTPSAAIPAGPVLYCTNGVIYCEKVNSIPVIKAIDIFGNNVDVPDIKYPAHMKNIAYEYAHHKMTGEPVYETLTLQRNLEVMALLDAAICSSKSGITESVVNVK